MSFRWWFGLERCRAALVFLGLAIAVGPLHGQDRLFVGSGEIGAFGRFGERIGPAPEPVYGEFAGGGRYVVSNWQAYDTQTGQAILLPAEVVGADPRRARLFLHDGATLSVFDLDTKTATPLGPLAPVTGWELGAPRVRLATDTDELVVLSRPLSFTTPGEFTVIDLKTGALARTFPIAGAVPFDLVADWRVTSDGRRLIVLTSGGLASIDTRDGAVLIRQPLSDWATGPGEIVDDRVHRRWYVRHQRQLTVVDDDLRPLAVLPLRSTCAQSALAFSPHTGRVYITDSEGGSQYFGQKIPISHFLSVYDAASGQRLGSRDVTRAAGVPDGSNSCSALPIAVVTAPGAPRALAATVTARDVTLSWTNVGDASNFVLDVGLAPARTDLTFSIGATSPVTIPNAPAGTYYLRVRGTNAFGVSRPSNEVAVTVR
jgi:hypothetical protein